MSQTPNNPHIATFTIPFITTKPENEIWVVYLHEAYTFDPLWKSPNPPTEDDFSWRNMYMGLCKLEDLTAFPDAHRNVEWVNRVKPTGAVRMHILMASSNVNEAATFRLHKSRDYQCYCNMYGTNVTNYSAGRVQCNETGIIYNNAAHACKMLSIPPSTMSAHLNGKPGHKTIYGKTYRRV